MGQTLWCIFMSLHAVYLATVFPSGVNRTPGWTETGEESKTWPSTNSYSSNSSWSILELLNTAATETGRATFEPFISEHEMHTGCICISNIQQTRLTTWYFQELQLYRNVTINIWISHIYLVHWWEPYILNYSPLCSVPTTAAANVSPALSSRIILCW